MKFVKRVVAYFENLNVPLSYYILTFLFILILRSFFEIFSDRIAKNPLAMTAERITIGSVVHLHYATFWIALALSLICLFYVLTKTDLLKVARVILPGFIIILLAPVLDLILSKGKGFNIDYMMPGLHDNLLLRFLTFFGDFPGRGVSPGMKIEIAIILLFSFTYFYAKVSSIVKSLFGTLLAYTLIFGFLATPFILKTLSDLIKIDVTNATQMLQIRFFSLIIFLLLLFLVYVKYRDVFRLIVKDIRPFRLLHFELMFLIGLAIGSKYAAFVPNHENIFQIPLIMIGIAFAWIYSVATNNIIDYNIDKITNKQRPLVESRIDLKDYTNLAWLFLFVALIYAALAGYTAFFIIALFIGNYYLYSMPPLRLKKIPFFSKLLISINSLALTLLGFVIVTGAFNNFPKSVVVLFLVGFTAVINFIDIKDYEGDKKEGIKTLPVILGLKAAKRLIGAFFVLAYLSVYLLVKEKYLLIPLFALGIVQFLLINRKKYSETPIFIVYLLSMVCLLLLLVFFPVKL